MTKISLNKIPYEGPKTHKQILDQIRADLAKTQNHISMERAELIVSSFFSKYVLFKDVPKKKQIYSPIIGTIYPGRVMKKGKRITAAKLKRYTGAKRYLQAREKRIVERKTYFLIQKYTRWSIRKERSTGQYFTFAWYMKDKKLVLPSERPITRQMIKNSLWRFNDDGVLVVKRKSVELKRHFAEITAKEKAEKALLNQH